MFFLEGTVSSTKVVSLKCMSFIKFDLSNKVFIRIVTVSEQREGNVKLPEITRNV